MYLLRTGCDGPSTLMTSSDQFTYQGFELDPSTGGVTCHYATARHTFTERFMFGPEGNWEDPAVRAAVRLLYLLAGVSYYKTTAARVIDLGQLVSTEAERAFLTRYYVNGLGEFAYRNGLDLGALVVTGPDAPVVPPAHYVPVAGRPLIPFGGGIDSIVTVEAMRGRSSDAALCVVHPPGDQFAAIEDAAAVTQLPITHIARAIDPQVRRSEELGFLNGHVPITAVITAAVLVAAVLDRRDAVVLSNEWSASVPTLIHDGTPVNHQWSKSLDFERDFAGLVASSLGPDIAVFSYLRARTELWVAQQFAELDQFHPLFRSCNRAFHQDPAQRLDHWCGVCDKCCFIDLVLAPFMSVTELSAVFAGHEPLQNPALQGRFQALLGLGANDKPFECVGDSNECRAALVLAGQRADRRGSALIPELLAALDTSVSDAASASSLLEPFGPHLIPDRYAPTDLLV
jgi:UDP-N-acetyl-alpha-D-muramoyl-L-alanyl-L-glutamate epimerase